MPKKIYITKHYRNTIAASAYHHARYCGLRLPLFWPIAASAYYICGVHLPHFLGIAACAYHFATSFSPKIYRESPPKTALRRLPTTCCGLCLPVLRLVPTTCCCVYLPLGTVLSTEVRDRAERESLRRALAAFTSLMKSECAHNRYLISMILRPSLRPSSRSQLCSTRCFSNSLKAASRNLRLSLVRL